MKKDENWIKKAFFYSKIAEREKEIPVGAVLVYKNKIIGVGSNRCISKKDPTAHAEIIAIREGAKEVKNYRLLNTQLYVTLEPCLMCLGAIVHSRINKVVYGCSSNNRNSSFFFSLLKKKYFLKKKIFQIKNKLLQYECAFILKKFFLKKRN